MSKFFSFLRLASCLILMSAALFLLPSCLNIKGQESVTLYENGSGQALFQYLFTPGKYSKQEIEGYLKQVNLLAGDTQGISGFNASYQENTETGTRTGYLQIGLTFDGLFPLSRLIGKVSEISSPLAAEVSRAALQTNTKIAGLNAVELSRDIAAPEQGTTEIVTMLTLPESPSASNASLTTNNGKTLVWKLAPSPSTPVSQTFTLSPWYILPQTTLAGMGGILAGAAAALVMIKIRKKKKGAKKEDSSRISS